MRLVNPALFSLSVSLSATYLIKAMFKELNVFVEARFKFRYEADFFLVYVLARKAIWCTTSKKLVDKFTVQTFNSENNQRLELLSRGSAA